MSARVEMLKIIRRTIADERSGCWLRLEIKYRVYHKKLKSRSKPKSRIASMHEHLSVIKFINNWNNMTTDYNIGFSVVGHFHRS